MIKTFYICLVIIVISFQIVIADVIDIEGKITDGNSAGISNARISLKKHPEIFTLTSSDGSFSLKSNTPAKRLSLTNTLETFTVYSTLKSRGFFIKSSKDHKLLSIDLFSLNGAKVLSLEYTNCTAGKRFVALPKNVSGIYILKVSVDTEMQLFTALCSRGDISLLEKRKRRSNSCVCLQADAGYEDTIIVYKQGFRTTLKKIISNTVNDVLISIQASKPWIPLQKSDLTYSGNMVKILAKGFDFEMGQPSESIWGYIDDLPTSDLEQPVHTVIFTHDFWMDTVEVQQGEFDSLMKKRYVNYSNDWNLTHGLGKDYPAYAVSWDDAVLFCNERSKRDGYDTVYSYTNISGTPGSKSVLINVTANISANGYYLPTEAQWEYACRGGTFTDYYWGKNLDFYQDKTSLTEVDSYAVWSNNSFVFGLGSPNFAVHQTGKKKPNSYGLYDIAGNVSEWCHDWMSSYSWGIVNDPAGPSTPTEENGEYHVSRGGNWGNDVSYLRSSNRYFSAPDYSYFFIGFRCVRTAE